MGIVFRQSVKTLVVTASGAILGALLLYFSARFLPGSTAFGFVKNMAYVTVVVSQLCMFGLNNTLYLYLKRFDTEKKKVLLTICFVGPIIFTGILSIAAFIFRQQLIHLYHKPTDILYTDKFFPWFLIYIFIWCYQILLETFAYAYMKTAIASFMREIVLRILNIILIFALFLNIIDFKWYVIWSVLVTIVTILILLWVALKEGSFKFSINFNLLTKEDYKDLINYTWSHLLYGISITLIDNLPLLLLGLFDVNGLSSVAVYTIAAYISSVSQIPYRSLSYSTAPILTEAYQEHNFEKVHDLFRRSAINILILVVIVLDLIGFNLPNAVAMLPPAYSAFGPVVIVLLLGRLIDMGTGLNSELIGISEYYKFNFRISFVLPVLMYIFCWLFIPHYGLYGAAWATTISIAIFNVCKTTFLWVKWRLIPFSKNTLLILLAGGIAALPGYFIPHFSNPFVDTIIRSVAIAVVYGGMLYLLQPSEDLRVYLLSVRENKRLF